MFIVQKWFPKTWFIILTSKDLWLSGCMFLFCTRNATASKDTGGWGGGEASSLQCFHNKRTHSNQRPMGCAPGGFTFSSPPCGGGGGRGTKNTRVKKNGMSPAQALQNKWGDGCASISMTQLTWRPMSCALCCAGRDKTTLTYVIHVIPRWTR